MSTSTTRAVHLAQKAGKIVQELVRKRRRELGTVEVYSRPVNGHGTVIEFIFTFVGEVDCKESGDTCKKAFQKILREEFPSESKNILKELKWKSFTIKKPFLNRGKCSISIEKTS